MSRYDEDPDGLEGQEPVEAGGSSPPEGKGPEGGTESTQEEKEQLERQNFELRKELREVRAAQLVQEHGLLPSHGEILAKIPRDEQLEAASRFAAELQQHGYGDPDLSPPRPAPTGAPSGAHVQGDQPSTAGTPVRTGGAQPAEGTFADPEAAEEIRASKGWGDLEAARDAAVRRKQEADYPNVPMDAARAAEGARNIDDYFGRLEQAKHEALTEARRSRKGGG